MISLEEIKTYLKIDYDAEDAYLQQATDVAKALIKEQTGVLYSEADKVYNQAVLFMVAHLYVNRMPLTEKATSSVPFTLEALILHIRIRGVYVE